MRLIGPTLIACLACGAAFAGDAQRPKASLKDADLSGPGQVRWIVEGCAAYPVTAGAQSKAPQAGAQSQAVAAPPSAPGS